MPSQGGFDSLGRSVGDLARCYCCTERCDELAGVALSLGEVDNAMAVVKLSVLRGQTFAAVEALFGSLGNKVCCLEFGKEIGGEAFEGLQLSFPFGVALGES